MYFDISIFNEINAIRFLVLFVYYFVHSDSSFFKEKEHLIHHLISPIFEYRYFFNKEDILLLNQLIISLYLENNIKDLYNSNLNRIKLFFLLPRNFLKASLLRVTKWVSPEQIAVAVLTNIKRKRLF